MNVIKETYLSLKKYKFITITTLVVLTFNLLILGIFMMLILNINLFVESIKSNVEISVFLKDGLQKTQIDSLLGRIRTKPGIDSCSFLSKDEALKEYIQLPDFKAYIDSLKVNPLPDAIKINVNRKYKDDIEKLRNIANSLKTLEGVSEVYYQEAETQKLFDIAGAIKNVVVGLSLILIIGSVLIVSSTIRMSVFARKDDIRHMRSLGISNLSIKSIFILEGIFQGIAGGILASVLLYILERILYDKINVLWFGRWQLMNGFYVLFMIIIGVSLGFISSLLFRVKNYSK